MAQEKPTLAQVDAVAHVLVFPYPAQGHLNCMLGLAELLVAAGLHVTFLDTDYHRRLLSRDDTTRLHFRSIPDGLHDDRPRTADRLMELIVSLATNSRATFRDLVISLRDNRAETDGFPPLTCVIADGIMPFAIDTAEELGVPAIAFRMVSATSYWAYLNIPSLLDSGEVPFPEGANLDEPVRSVPGMESFLRRRDLPSFIRGVNDSNDPLLQLLSTVTAHSTGARAFILNSSDVLEPTAIRHVRAHMRDTFAIGPIHAYARSRLTSSTVASLWQEDRTCMSWLDEQPDRSVVYVSFGSFAVMSQHDTDEFLAGLVGSGHRFLWVVRPDMTKSGLDSLPDERFRIVDWAPQQDVLAHRAVGCFLTHSGWNSTLESVVEGVPMLCWPYFADQQVNSRLVGAVWRVGLDMKDVCERSVVASMVREAMEGDKAAEMRRSARELAEALRRSVAVGGPSYAEFERLVRYINYMTQHAC